MGSKVRVGDGIAKGKQPWCWQEGTNGSCWGTCWENLSKDLQMLIAAVPVTAKLSKAAVVSTSWRMVDGIMAAFGSS